MKKVLQYWYASARHVRRLRSQWFDDPIKLNSATVNRSKPVDWLNDATTYSDLHNAIIDPTSTPYSDQEIKKVVKKSQVCTRREKRIMKLINRNEGINFDHIPLRDQVVILFPGQGSQYVGMGKTVLDCSQAADVFQRASEILQYDLKKVCLEGPRSKLDQTIYCQPAMLVTCLAAWESLKISNEWLIDKVTASAGFSVGEFASLVLAGVLKFEDAVKFVKIRAERMHECSQQIPSGMLTVRTTAISRLSAAIKDARLHAEKQDERPICQVSNYLCTHVKVIGASETCMNYLLQNANQYSFQVVKKLAVSGAFHTVLMNDAASSLVEVINDLPLNPPVINLFSNCTGNLYPHSINQIRKNIVRQICHSVKWEQIQFHLFHLNRDNEFPVYMEVGPGRQLGSMFHNISKKAYAHYKSYPA